MKKTWQLFVDRLPLKGSWNMAVDEYLLSRLGEAPATCLRFYGWEKPTASLGASQEAARALDLDFCRRLKVDIVRRITGGKMVLHDRELTYALASNDEELFGSTVGESYLKISVALGLGLRKLGLRAEPAGATPEEYSRGDLPCFSRAGRDELQVEGRKILGSAQRRLAGRFLQHGSLPLEHDEDMLRSVSRLAAETDVRMTSLAKLLGKSVSAAAAADSLAEGFAETFGVRLEPMALAPAEREAVRRLQRLRYEDEGWTFQGRPPAGVDF